MRIHRLTALLLSLLLLASLAGAALAAVPASAVFLRIGRKHR